jgi:hypothetical protein
MTPLPTALETALTDTPRASPAQDLPVPNITGDAAQASSEGLAPVAARDLGVLPTCRGDPTTGGPVLSVRVSRAEAKAFDQVLRSAGFRFRSEALRALVRGAVGSVAPLPQEAELLTELAHELHKIGVNVNQIALAANRRQIALMRAEWDALTALRELLPDLRLAIARLVDHRRRAGAAVLASSGAGPGLRTNVLTGETRPPEVSVMGREAARG